MAACTALLYSASAIACAICHQKCGRHLTAQDPRPLHCCYTLLWMMMLDYPACASLHHATSAEACGHGHCLTTPEKPVAEHHSHSKSSSIVVVKAYAALHRSKCVGTRTCISSLMLQQCGSSRQVTSAVGSRTNAAKLRRSTRVSDSPSPPAAYATRSPDQVAAKPLCSRRRAVSAGTNSCQCPPVVVIANYTDNARSPWQPKLVVTQSSAPISVCCVAQMLSSTSKTGAVLRSLPAGRGR